MRSPLILAAATPLALLASCGQTTPADQVAVEPMDTEVAELDMASDALPEVPADALDQVAFSGAYVREGSEGNERLMLDAANDTYQYTAPNGTISRGSFTRLPDNRRLMIDDLNGQPAYFAIANGSIYRLDNASTPPDEITVTSQYRRDNSATAPVDAPVLPVASSMDEQTDGSAAAPAEGTADEPAL